MRHISVPNVLIFNFHSSRLELATLPIILVSLVSLEPFHPAVNSTMGARRSRGSLTLITRSLLLVRPSTSVVVISKLCLPVWVELLRKNYNEFLVIDLQDRYLTSALDLLEI